MAPALGAAAEYARAPAERLAPRKIGTVGTKGERRALIRTP